MKTVLYKSTIWNHTVIWDIILKMLFLARKKNNYHQNQKIKILMCQNNLKISWLLKNTVVLINHKKIAHHININLDQSILMNRIIISEISLLETYKLN